MFALSSDIISISGNAVSSIGGRSENQDDFCFVDTPLGFLIVICDGMGGGPGGKTASYIAKYEIARTIAECNATTSPRHAFKMGVAHAQEALKCRMEQTPALVGMGSTFVALLINKRSAFIAHAGDSRCYLIRRGKCVFRTIDHSLVGELVKNKALTEEEARRSPQSNIITRGLGSVSNNVPEIDEVSFRKGDRFVLCTDGVWGIMPNTDLIKAFSADVSTSRLIDHIDKEIDLIGAGNGGGHDNHTIAVIVPNVDSDLKPEFHFDLKKSLIIGGISCAVIIICLCLILFLPRSASDREDDSEIGVKSWTATLAETLGNSDDQAKDKSENPDGRVNEADNAYAMQVDSLRHAVNGLKEPIDAKEERQNSESEANPPAASKEKNNKSETPNKNVSIDALKKKLEELRDMKVPESEKSEGAINRRNSICKEAHNLAENLKEKYKDGDLSKSLGRISFYTQDKHINDKFPINKPIENFYRLTKGGEKNAQDLIDRLDGNNPKRQSN